MDMARGPARWVVGVTTCLVFGSAARGAAAQSAPTAFVTPWTGDQGEPSYDQRFEPIRRGMLADYPAGGAAEGPCENREGGTGQWRLFDPRMSATTSYHTLRSTSLAPRLSLVGFSRGGCPLDGAAGGALVFAQPLPRAYSLLLSAGAMYAPHYASGGRGVVDQQARIDVVTPSGVTFGLAAGRGGPRVTVGGVW